METIFITGFSGVGKTMIGKLLSSRKNLKYLDLDEAIEKKENKSIDKIFSENGEEYFRQIEKHTLKTSVSQGMIVSLGGGTPILDDNRHFIKRTGRTLYLRAKPSTIYNHIKKEYENRPLLREDFSELKIDKLLEERTPYYEELANFIIDIDGKNINEVLTEALAIYNMNCKVKCHIMIK